MGFAKESGASKIVILIVLVAVALGGFTAWKFIQARIAIYDFEEKVGDTARFASFKGDKEEAIKQVREEVMRKAREVFGDGKVPFAEEAVMVSMDKQIQIRVQYVYKVKTPFYTYNWNVSVDRQSSQF